MSQSPGQKETEHRGRQAESGGIEKCLFPQRTDKHIQNQTKVSGVEFIKRQPRTYDLSQHRRQRQQHQHGQDSQDAETRNIFF